MGFYENGIKGNVGFLGIGTPGDIKAQGESVNTDIMATVKDAKAVEDKLPKDLVANFLAFVKEWITYWQVDKPSGWWSSNSKTIISYRDRLLAWRELLKRNGMTVTSPDPIVPKDEGFFSRNWKAIGVVALAIGGYKYFTRKKEG